MADVYKQSFKQNYTNNIELSIFNCGLERCAPGQTWGPGIRDHYLIHLVVSGKGVFEVGGRTYEVVPGDLFFARPSQLPGETLYRKLKENGVLVRWFDADRIRDYIRITIGSMEQMETLVEELTAILEEL